MSGVLPLGFSEYQNLRLRHRQPGFLRLASVVDERKFPDALRGEQSTYVCNGLVHGVRDSLDKNHTGGRSSAGSAISVIAKTPSRTERGTLGTAGNLLHGFQR
jgi:hypothetical protein